MIYSQSRKRSSCITPPLSEDSGVKKGKNLRSEELREIASSVRNGTFDYEGKPKHSIDWASYDEAHVNELADMLNAIRDIVDEASRRIAERSTGTARGAGRPSVPASDRTKTLLMQGYFGASNRVAAGLVRVFREKLRISTEFSYETIERSYDPGSVTEILDEVFRITNEMGNGSGDPSTVKVNYESRRSEQRREREKNGRKERGL